MTGYRPKTLLNVDANPKTVKGQKKGYITAVLYLAPASESGYNVCAKATVACKWLCLNKTGRAGILKAGAAYLPIDVQLRPGCSGKRWIATGFS